MLRRAKPSDGQIVAPMIYSAIEDLAESFTGAYHRDEAVERLAILFALEGNRFSFEFAVVIEELGEVVAVASAYHEQYVDLLTDQTIKLANQQHWQIKDAIAQCLKDEKEAPRGTFYIDHIAVCEKARGKGYARLLIQHLEEVASERGHGVVSLLADVTNPKAKNLYEKLGYKFSEIVFANGHQYHALKKEVIKSK